MLKYNIDKKSLVFLIGLIVLSVIYLIFLIWAAFEKPGEIVSPIPEIYQVK